MDSKKIYLTKEGLNELKKEHDGLVKVRRPEVLSRVSQARNLGDLSENAEYTVAREELSFVDGRIGELEELLKQVEIISSNKSHSAVKLGSTVTEADPKEKKISHESPLGSALIGKKVGEKVEVEAPAGKITYTVDSIK